MAFSFSVMLNDPADIGNVEDAPLVADLRQAAADWSQHIAGIGTLVIQLNIGNDSIGLASGGPAASIPVGVADGRTLLEPSSIYELGTGTHLSGTTADIVVNVNPAVLGELYANPDPADGQAVPAGLYDAVSIFRHELAHGFGFGGHTAIDGSLGPYESLFDHYIQQNADGTADFVGPTAEAVFGGPVPLTVLPGDAENYFHLANSHSAPNGTDLMSGIGLSSGVSIPISKLDLAILEDVGAPITDGPQAAITAETLARDTGVSAADFVTNDGSITLAGTAGDSLVALAGVEILDATVDLGTVTVSASGAWSFSTTLVQGTHALIAVATDRAGNSSEAAAAPDAVVVDTTGPGMAIAGETLAQEDGTTTGGLVTDDGAVTLSGSADDALSGVAGVEFFDGNQGYLGAATLGVGDGWSLTTTLGAGTHHLLAVAIDRAGNVGPAVLAPDAVVVLAGSDTVTGVGGTVSIPFDDADNAAFAIAPLAMVNAAIGAGSVVAAFTGAAGTPPPGKTGMLQIDSGGAFGLPDGYATAIDTAGTPVTVFGGMAANELVVSGVSGLTFSAGSGAGTVISGAGNNLISIDPGHGGQDIRLGGGDDTVLAAGGGNTIDAGFGANAIYLGSGADLVYSRGDDTVVAGSGAATVVAAAGGQTHAYGGAGLFLFVGGTSAATVASGSGAATLFGGDNGDLLVGGGGNDMIIGGAGPSTIFGGTGASTIFGGGGGTEIVGGGNAGDVIVVGAGNETVAGAAAGGSDALFAGSGNDALFGGAGFIAMFAGSGDDQMIGGGGGNLFGFDNGSAGGSDVIWGFVQGRDHVQLDHYAGGTMQAVLNAATVAGGSTTIVLPDETRILFAGVTGLGAGDFS